MLCCATRGTVVIAGGRMLRLKAVALLYNQHCAVHWVLVCDYVLFHKNAACFRLATSTRLLGLSYLQCCPDREPCYDAVITVRSVETTSSRRSESRRATRTRSSIDEHCAAVRRDTVCCSSSSILLPPPPSRHARLHSGHRSFALVAGRRSAQSRTISGVADRQP